MKKASIALALLATSGVTAQELVLGADDKTLRQRNAFAGSPGSSTDADLASRVETLQSQLNSIQAQLENQQLLDTEPPVVVVDVPANRTGRSFPLTVTANDNQGLYRLFVTEKIKTTPGGYVLSGEKTFQAEWKWGNPFGDTYSVTAYAIDLSGNVSVSTHYITSDAAIKSGTYKLDSPLTDDYNLLGCGGPMTVNVTQMYFGGYYKDAGSKCDYDNADEDPAAIACVSASFNLENMSSVNPKTTINFEDETIFILEEQNTYGDTTLTTSIDLEFLDIATPSIKADISITCESTEYGTEQWGPFSVSGTLVE